MLALDFFFLQICQSNNLLVLNEKKKKNYWNFD